MQQQKLFAGRKHGTTKKREFWQVLDNLPFSILHVFPEGMQAQ